jgi:hypothetical protein
MQRLPARQPRHQRRLGIADRKLHETRALAAHPPLQGDLAFGTRAFFPKTNGSDNPEEVLAAFFSQYYG